MVKHTCFSINTYTQFEELIKIKNSKKKLLIVFIKNYLVKGFGINWVHTLITLIKKNYPYRNIKFYVDAGNDYGLSILMLRENIDYLKLKSNIVVLKKINQIAKKNKVLLNPDFNVVDLTKLKNYKQLKI